MPIYCYLGITKNGSKIQGKQWSPSRKELLAKLQQQKILPLKISYDLFRYSFFPIIKKAEVNRLIEQLAVLVHANLPLIKALSLIKQDETNPKLKSLITSCQNSLLAGNSFYQTLNNYPDYFSPLSRSLVNVGEHSGSLDLMLIEISSYLKKITSQKNKVIQALTYPLIILLVSLVVITILLVWVIPQFVTMFNSFGASLPLYTKLIIKLSVLLHLIWYKALIWLVITIALNKVIYDRSLKFRYLFAKMVLKLPLLKKVLLYAMIGRFTKTLGLTLKAGVPLLKAINISMTTITNLYYQESIHQANILIASGSSLCQAFVLQKLFPNQVIQLIALGEESGTLTTSLEKISILYEEKLVNLTEKLNDLLEPVIILVLGVIIGGLVIGIYLPIFNLGSII